jgi:hypothetical protein
MRHILGLDIHGVIDAYPKQYAEMSKLYYEAGHEVHVITGARWSEQVKTELREAGIWHTHFFSILEEHDARGTVIHRDDEGFEWIDESLWDKTKAEYCREVGVTFMIDNSPVYGEFFRGIDTIYLSQIPSADTPPRPLDTVVSGMRKIGSRP